jgi:hypothetical protein
MRALDFTAVTAAYYAYFDSPPWQDAIGWFVDRPTIDGITVVADPIQLAKSQRMPPLLAGHCRDEAASFNDLPCPLGAPFCTDYGGTPDALDAQLSFFGPVYPWARYQGATLQSLEQLYSLDKYPSVYRALMDFASDNGWGLTADQLAKNASSGDDANPVYRYVFAHTLQDQTHPRYPIFQALGASHLRQEAFYLGFRDFIAGDYQPTPAEQTLSSQMSDYWTNFAKRGDPNGMGLPTWPRFDRDSLQVMVLDTPAAAVPGYRAPESALAAQIFEAYDRGTAPEFPWIESPCTGVCADDLSWFIGNGGTIPPSPYAPGW